MRKRRRRGEELETAILNATWSEITEVGVTKLSMESIAKRAHTGVAVLYRRWSNKTDLVKAAIQHYRACNPVASPDTGSLREDLTETLISLSSVRANVYAVLGAAYISGNVGDAKANPQQVRRDFIGKGTDNRTRPMYIRADKRGEIRLSLIPDSALAMPFDLVGYEMIMNLAPLEPNRISAIVNELFMPLVRQYSFGKRDDTDPAPQVR